MTTSDRPLLLAAHLLCILVGIQAASVFEAYRLVQYDDHEGHHFGSRTVRLAQYATLKREGATLFRSVVLLPFKEATLQIVKEILDPAAGVAGLVFLLPSNDAAASPLEHGDVELFAELEKFLILNAVAIPVYFVHENDELIEIMHSIVMRINAGKPPGNVYGGYMLQIKSGNAKPLKRPAVHNYEGWLMGSDGSKTGRGSTSTIVVSAHYDTFDTVPGLPGGGNGSGIVALLALMRHFSALYKDPATRPNTNLLFLLTGGGGIDFFGLRAWLETAGTRVLDSVEFFISLDDLSGISADSGLYLHYSKPPKDSVVSDWYGRFEKAAELEEIRLSSIHKKINVALPYRAWEHEHVAQKRILGVTLSGQGDGGDPMLRSSVLDGPASVNQKSLAKAISVVGNAISMKLFEEEGREFPVFTASYRIPIRRSAFLDKWLVSLGRLPRMAPFLSQEDSFSAAVTQFFEAHADKNSQSAVKLQSAVKKQPAFVFYDEIQSEIGAYKAAGVLFDLLLLLAVALYLALLFVALKITTQGWQAFLSVFSTSEKKWKRSKHGRKGVAEKLLSSARK